MGNSPNQNRINLNEQNENTGERRQYGQGARNRERSQDPANLSFFNILFNNMFPVIISTSNEQPFRIIVQRQNVNQSIFDPLFLTFGVVFDNNFRDNFSSNFRSNFRGNFANQIMNILSLNMAELRKKKQNPISEQNLEKLKKFNLTEDYCKKEGDNIEKPNCSICLEGIEIGKETVLLPCGHMFHSNCCITWLKKCNTCPICRFEIK